MRSVKEDGLKEVKFPCLMKNKATDTIILATGRKDLSLFGFVVHAKDIPIGDLADGYSLTKFTPYSGTVTLSNE